MILQSVLEDKIITGRENLNHLYLHFILMTGSKNLHRQLQMAENGEPGFPEE